MLVFLITLLAKIMKNQQRFFYLGPLSLKCQVRSKGSWSGLWMAKFLKKKKKNINYKKNMFIFVSRVYIEFPDY